MVFWNQTEEIKREKGKKTKIHTKATGALKVRGDRASTSSSTTRSSTSHPLPPFHQRHFHHQTNQGLLPWHPKPKWDSDHATGKNPAKLQRWAENWENHLKRINWWAWWCLNRNCQTLVKLFLFFLSLLLFFFFNGFGMRGIRGGCTRAVVVLERNLLSPSPSPSPAAVVILITTEMF